MCAGPKLQDLHTVKDNINVVLVFWTSFNERQQLEEVAEKCLNISGTFSAEGDWMNVINFALLTTGHEHVSIDNRGNLYKFLFREVDFFSFFKQTNLT